jgi:hypothetical protein
LCHDSSSRNPLKITTAGTLGFKEQGYVQSYFVECFERMNTSRSFNLFRERMMVVGSGCQFGCSISSATGCSAVRTYLRKNSPDFTEKHKSRNATEKSILF